MSQSRQAKYRLCCSVFGQFASGRRRLAPNLRMVERNLTGTETSMVGRTRMSANQNSLPLIRHTVGWVVRIGLVVMLFSIPLAAYL